MCCFNASGSNSHNPCNSTQSNATDACHNVKLSHVLSECTRVPRRPHHKSPIASILVTDLLILLKVDHFYDLSICYFPEIFFGCKDNPIILPSRWAPHLAQPNHQAFAVSIGLKEASDLENLKVWHKFDFPSGVYQRCQVQSAGLFEGYAANKSQNILNHKHFHCMGWSKKLYLWFVFGKHWTVCAMQALSAASPSKSPINTLKKCIQAV